MSAEATFAIATLLTWAALAFLLRGLYLGVLWASRQPGSDIARIRAGALLCIGISAALLLISTGIPKGPPGAQGSFAFPLVWFVMPFAAWLCAFSVVMSLIRAIQGVQALESETRKSRFIASAAWLVAGALGWFVFRNSSDQITMLRGVIPVSLPTLGAIAALLIASGIGMVISARSAVRRGWTKAIATHIALLAGSLIFGLPFAWLLITSFKEDRDMASAEGIVWVPRVQETVPYLDPEDPLIETDFQGTTVQGTIVERLPDGSAKLEILTPAVLRSQYCFAKPPLKQVPKEIPVVTGNFEGQEASGNVVKELDDGRRLVEITSPETLAGKRYTVLPSEVKPVRRIGLRLQNYSEALEFLPPETNRGLVYIKNTLIIVILSVIGTLLSSSIVAYAFARMRFPGRNALFLVLLSTMMLPAAVTLLPQFLIFRSLGWIDTLLPLWVPAFFGSAFNIFLLRQFFMSIPMELEDASKIDGASYLRTFWQVMLPQIKPALAVVAIWTFIGAWNNFMGPLVYINSPENMPISYAVQLFQGDRGGEPGLLMAFATMAMLPVILVFLFAQKYFIEGVTLSGLGGR